MLTGTETNPKEIVAVAIERAGMVRSKKRVECASAEAWRHKYFLRGKLWYRMLTFDDDRRKSESTVEVKV